MNLVYKPEILIGQLATAALLEEVYTAPKPGLVDPYSNGAHKDMNLDTFKESAKAIAPCFEEMALLGILMYEEPENLFPVIRRTGQKAEQAMYEATGGVNTHKGAIFTLGILSAAAGVCCRKLCRITLDTLLETEQKMTRTILLGELEQLKSRAPKSSGERNLFQYGSKGIRGEAAEGYPSIRNYGLPVLRGGIRSGHSWNQVKIQVLMTLMCSVEDGNILARTGMEGLKQVQSAACTFLKTGGAYAAGAEKKLELLDLHFTEKNYSNGGCADLLAATIFINSLIETFKDRRDFIAGRKAIQRQRIGATEKISGIHGA